MFNKLRIVTLLMLCSLLLLAIFLLSNGISALFLKKGNNTINQLNTEISTTLNVTDTTNWIRAARTTLLSALPYVNDSDPARLNKVLEQAQFYLDGSRQRMDAYQAAPKPEQEKALAAELLLAYSDYLQKGVMPQLDALRRRDATAFLNIASTTAVEYDEKYRVPLDAFIKVHNTASNALTHQAADDNRLSYQVLGLSIALFLMVIVAVFFLLRRTLIRPLAFAGEVTSAIGQGDLNTRIVHRRRDEIGHVLHGLAQMQQKLVQVIGDVIQGIRQVERVASDMSDSSINLSSRTEQQAAALEETAASMEQLSSTVKQNADNARHASQLALNASDTAQQGGAMMERVVKTMEEIKDSSQRINEINAVINSIAFQTNILALNAAVEAARAGEHGRGFAVVASEVRNLAQRSAQAAKDIEQLIKQSIDRVNTGASLIGEVATTSDAIISAVKNVTDIMEEIAAASEEQSRGINQVGQAITEMDRVTQQNATLVHESTRAAATLDEQVSQLSQAIAIFRQDAKPRPTPATPAPQSGALPAANAPRLAAKPAAGDGGWEKF